MASVVGEGTGWLTAVPGGGTVPEPVRIGGGVGWRVSGGRPSTVNPAASRSPTGIRTGPVPGPWLPSARRLFGKAPASSRRRRVRRAAPVAAAASVRVRTRSARCPGVGWGTGSGTGSGTGPGTGSDTGSSSVTGPGHRPHPARPAHSAVATHLGRRDGAPDSTGHAFGRRAHPGSYRCDPSGCARHCNGHAACDTVPTPPVPFGEFGGNSSSQRCQHPGRTGNGPPPAGAGAALSSTRPGSDCPRCHQRPGHRPLGHQCHVEQERLAMVAASTCSPTGRPSTSPAGMLTAGLPFMFDGAVRAALFMRPGRSRSPG